MNEVDILWRLGLALALSSLIGLEREMRQKSAGLRTQTLVGVGSAVFMLVSIFGFSDVLNQGHITLDPSRVAAQIVSGIGFIGGGIIFVRQDAVRGLTTAAAVWVTAGVGMACAGNLPVVAAVTTGIYFVVAYGYPPLVDRLPVSKRAPSEMRLVYQDGRGILRQALEQCVKRGFSISDVSIRRGRDSDQVVVDLELRGAGSMTDLAAELSDMDGIFDVRAGDMSEASA
jgi:putative Mg2+ transporter-C (MgtC) family protein